MVLEDETNKLAACKVEEEGSPVFPHHTQIEINKTVQTKIRLCTHWRGRHTIYHIYIRMLYSKLQTKYILIYGNTTSKTFNS